MSDDGGPPTKNHDVVEKWADRNWHMLPQSYPNYKMVRRRFQAWCRDEILRRLLTDVANEPGSFLRSSWALAAISS